MYRRIISRFYGRCAKCGDAYYRGDSIYWEKGNRAIFHSRCYGNEPKPEPVHVETVTTPGAFDSRFTIGELKAEYAKAADGDLSSFQISANRENVNDVRSCINPDTDARWYGFTRADVKGWLKNGYQTEAFKNLHEFSPPIRKRRKMVYGDEGEIQADLALSGFDYPFLQWTKRETAPGLAVDITLQFSSSMPAAVITDYQRWVARTLYTLEIEGIDLEVNAVNTVSRLLQGYDGNVTTTINVKREGEATDFNRWSVLFSPAGFRGLVFFAKYLGGDRHGRRVHTTLGYPVDGTWDITFDPDRRKITIRQPRHADSFPADEMSEKLRAIVKSFR